jgi:hypothetical protein
MNVKTWAREEPLEGRIGFFLCVVFHIIGHLNFAGVFAFPGGFIPVNENDIGMGTVIGFQRQDSL